MLAGRMLEKLPKTYFSTDKGVLYKALVYSENPSTFCLFFSSSKNCYYLSDRETLLGYQFLSNCYQVGRDYGGQLVWIILCYPHVSSRIALLWYSQLSKHSVSISNMTGMNKQSDGCVMPHFLNSRGVFSTMYLDVSGSRCPVFTMKVSSYLAV